MSEWESSEELSTQARTALHLIEENHSTTSASETKGC